MLQKDFSNVGDSSELYQGPLQREISRLPLASPACHEDPWSNVHKVKWAFKKNEKTFSKMENNTPRCYGSTMADVLPLCCIFIPDHPIKSWTIGNRC